MSCGCWGWPQCLLAAAEPRAQGVPGQAVLPGCHSRGIQQLLLPTVSPGTAAGTRGSALCVPRVSWGLLVPLGTNSPSPKPFTGTWHLHTPGHLVTAVYLSKSVIGQCLNNNICILVPILFHLHFWSQPEKERQFLVQYKPLFQQLRMRALCLIPEGNFSAVRSCLSHLIQSSSLLPRELVSNS